MGSNMADKWPAGFDVENSAQNCYLAVADFIIAVKNADTAAECRRIHKIIEDVLASLEAASESALERSKELL